MRGVGRRGGGLIRNLAFQLDFVTDYLYIPCAIRFLFAFVFISWFFPFPFFLFVFSSPWAGFKQGEVASQFSQTLGVSFEHGMLGVYQGMQLQLGLGTGYGSLAWAGFGLTQWRSSDSVVLWLFLFFPSSLFFLLFLGWFVLSRFA